MIFSTYGRFFRGAAVGTAMACGLGAVAAAQETSFTPEQKLEIEKIVQDVIIARMSGEGAGDGSVVLVDAGDPEKIAETAQRYGSAELTTDTLGDPLVRGEIDGVRYDVYFYGCEDSKGCKNLQFRAVWDYKEATDADATRWNREKRFGKAYLDSDGNLVLEMNVNLDFGVSNENLADTFDWWRVVMGEFVTYYSL